MADYIAKIKTPDGTSRNIGGDNFDNPWVYKGVTLVQNTTLAANGSTTLNLSAQLPEAGYDYEVLISIAGASSTALGNWGRVKIWSTNFIGIMLGTMKCELKGVAGYVRTNGVLPLSKNSYSITVKNVANLPINEFGVWLRAYRKVGTND